MCDDDIITAKAMLDAGRLPWAGFICHLVIEKALKAVIVNKTNETPPKIHDLRSLAKLANIIKTLSDEQLDLLDELNPLQIEARYPEYKSKIAATLTPEKCHALFQKVEEFVCWTKITLEK